MAPSIALSRATRNSAHSRHPRRSQCGKSGKGGGRQKDELSRMCDTVVSDALSATLGQVLRYQQVRPDAQPDDLAEMPQSDEARGEAEDDDDERAGRARRRRRRAGGGYRCQARPRPSVRGPREEKSTPPSREVRPRGLHSLKPTRTSRRHSIVVNDGGRRRRGGHHLRLADVPELSRGGRRRRTPTEDMWRSERERSSPRLWPQRATPDRGQGGAAAPRSKFNKRRNEEQNKHEGRKYSTAHILRRSQPKS